MISPYLLPIGAVFTMTLLAFTDHRSGRMPNWLTLGSWTLALFVQGALGGVGGVLAALIGCLIVAAAPLGLFVLTKGDGIGGGDVKALFALGAWLGVLPGLQAELLGLLVLAAFAYTKEAKNGRLGALLLRSFALFIPHSRAPAVGRTISTHEPSSREFISLRFGPFLAFGTWSVCLSILLSGSGFGI